jgi:hypothetical protein
MQTAMEEGYRPDRELSNLVGDWVNPTATEQADLAGGYEGQGTRSSPGQIEGTRRGSDDDPDLRQRECRGEGGKLHHCIHQYMDPKDRLGDVPVLQVSQPRAPRRTARYVSPAPTLDASRAALGPRPNWIAV